MKGRILWFDGRHLEGQVLSDDGRKFYFNYSVMDSVEVGLVNRDMRASFSVDAQGVNFLKLDLEGVSKCILKA